MKTIILKKSLLSAFLFIAFTMSAFASNNDVSKYLVKQFQKQFQHATNVAWKTTSNFTSATFTLDGEKTSVFYNTGNELIAVSREITVQDLPKAAQRSLNKKYSNKNISSVIDFTDAAGNESYYIQLDGNNEKTIILQSDEAGNISDFQTL
ncbi:MAG: hypothetical protein M3R72_10375 [Bacteroidota bacterium]|nr:hypothetical protein [Bacteroidota bacterium]